MKRLIFLIFLVIGVYNESLCGKKYSSPTGSQTNKGDTQVDSWSLDFALSGSAPLFAGDTLVMLDGIYEGNFTSNLIGSPGKPIVILALNQGKAIIDVGKKRTTGSGITINGSYTWFVGIHLTSSSLIRKSDASNGFPAIPYESGISVFGDNNKIINCWIYDVVGGGLELWRSGLNLEVYGCVIFNNGSQDVSRGTGHGMYIQHDQTDQPKIIENNYIFQNASQGINIFTTNPANKGVIVKRNVSFNTGVIATFDPFLFRPPHNLTIGSQNNISSDMEVRSNLFYSDLQGGRLATNDVSNVTLGRNYSPNQDISFDDNIVFGGRNQVEFQPLDGLSFQRNKLLNVHGSFFAFLGNSSSFPNSIWDSNVYSNIANTDKPFQGLNFSQWQSDFFPFDNTSSYSIYPTKTREVLITQNKYNPFQFHISILSFTGSELIELDFSDFSEFKDVAYEISDFQNPFDPSQKVSSTFDGASIRFPMNWTKSLQPKGNMPFQAVHTDLSFGTFLLVFERGEDVPVVFPGVKDSVALFLNEEGKAFLTSNDFLVNPPSEPFTFVSSGGFEFSCSNIGTTLISITSKNTRTGEEQIDQTLVWVFDTIPPYFDAANATFLFDPVVGKVSFSIADFDVIDFKDNCAKNWNIMQSRFEVTCADIYENLEMPVWEFPVDLISTDPSGNSFSRRVKVIIGNVIESQKVSITSLDPLIDDGTSILRLGNELEYQVLEWTKNGVVISGQNEKEISISSSGRYQAKLLLSTGCMVESSLIIYEDPNLPSGYRDDVTLILDGSGKSTLTLKDVFGVTEGIANEVIFGQTEFNCSDLGTKKVKITLKYQSSPLNLSQNYSEEFWINVIVKDTTAPVFEEMYTPVNFNFDLSVGELILDPKNFFKTLPQDNCGSDFIKIQLSQSKITCADVDSEKISYPVTFQISVSDASGNSRAFPATANLNIVESVKVSLTKKGVFNVGGTVELTLGNELDYTVLEWRKNSNLILEQVGKSLIVSEPGIYSAWLKLANGCPVSSVTIEVTESDTSYPLIKESIELILDESGKADLTPENVFVNWPLSDPNLEITLDPKSFTCDNIGEKTVKILIKSQSGQTWEKIIKVLVKDQSPPVLVPKNINLELDVTKGVVEISPEMLLAEFGDNCSIKSLTINKNRFTCEDLGKEFSVAIRAEDKSKNVTEAVAKVSIVRKEAEKVVISGPTSFCKGEKGVLELSSSLPFEVVRWRRNGAEIQGQTGKKLEVSESGIYHAVIRYPGGCLSESKDFEVKVNPLPEGEIKVDGNILRAPEGNFTYQWYRNGEKLEGKTTRTYTAELMGEYAVELTSSAACKALLKSVTLTISGIFGTLVNQALNLKIYPNPASSRVLIEFPDGVLAAKPSISVYSSEGKNVTEMVQIIVLNDTDAEIRLNRITKGTYLIWAIGTDQKTYFGKLIVL
jgi:hypothetical protein